MEKSYKNHGQLLQQQNKQSGAVLITVMCILFVLTLLVMSSLDTAILEAKMTNAYKEYFQQGR